MNLTEPYFAVAGRENEFLEVCSDLFVCSTNCVAVWRGSIIVTILTTIESLAEDLIGVELDFGRFGTTTVDQIIKHSKVMNLLVK